MMNKQSTTKKIQCMVSILQVYVPFKLNFIQHILFMPITTKAINFFSIYAFVSVEYHWFIHWPTAATLRRFLVMHYVGTLTHGH